MVIACCTAAVGRERTGLAGCATLRKKLCYHESDVFVIMSLMLCSWAAPEQCSTARLGSETPPLRPCAPSGISTWATFWCKLFFRMGFHRGKRKLFSEWVSTEEEERPAGNICFRFGHMETTPRTRFPPLTQNYHGVDDANDDHNDDDDKDDDDGNLKSPNRSFPHLPSTLVSRCRELSWLVKA